MSTAPTESPRFFGRYELVHLLGQGGMGEVYLAKLSGAAGFEKPCIVKTILPGLVKDRQFLDRFHHEAKVLVHLVHSSIAQVYDMGEADGTYYMALEYVAGVDLGYLLEQARVQGRAVPAPVALYIGQRMAEGLGYAHRKTGTDGEPLGIVHRDVSPHNVMVSYEGEVKVIDFGLAKSTARSKYTLPSTVMGKLGYMSPEQVRAEPLDHRSDIYSCAVVVWEMLAGRGLVPHGTVGEMMAAMSHPVVPPLTDFRPDVEPSLEAVLRRALAPSPTDRYGRADEFARALNAELLRSGNPIGAEEAGEFVRALCPEAFAEQRKLTSSVHGERRTPSPAPRGGSGTGLYGGSGSGSADVQATAPGTGEESTGNRPNTGRIDVDGPGLGPGGTFVSHPSGSGGVAPSTSGSGGVARSTPGSGGVARSTTGSGGVARSTDEVDAAALGATAVHLAAAPSQGAGVAGTSGQLPAQTGSRRPVARIAVAALLLVGASVGITAYVLRPHTAEQPVVPQTLPPSEPVVAAAPPKVEEPTPAVTPPEEPPPEATVDAGAGEQPEVKPEPVVKAPPESKPVPGPKRPATPAVEMVPAHLAVAKIGETGGGQRVVNVTVPSGINAGTVFKVVGPPQKGTRKRAVLGTATVVSIQPNRGQMTLRLDAEADAAKEPRFVLMAVRPSGPTLPPSASVPEPTQVAAPAPEPKPVERSRLLGQVEIDGVLGSSFNSVLYVNSSDTRTWHNCAIVLNGRKEARMASLEPYRTHRVKVEEPYFKVNYKAPAVPEKAVWVSCDEGEDTFALIRR
ncbi:protein kinase [Corallococcus exiguus]|uniref:serine/threonine protein kinase n=1 Tax=Corallococcus TaxID=83461 RepID=UPI000EBD21BF|nr:MULTISPECIES: serine/threonine-protein kinase [Corallococcus]NNB84773.1 protein kinase [Corallococcus exiguus]NNB96797.1 protein kinase [Corallococcus exiguus]NNC03053.1 protein kinase [Corallococcus exiguus]NPC45788.1 protein kinase [Corallococcus exiguus]RKH85428.1 serine/threonine protein kinase [Corallococcus sp. AB032C]